MRRVRFVVQFASALDVATLSPRQVEGFWRRYRVFCGLPWHRLGTMPGIGLRVGSAVKEPAAAARAWPGLRARQLAEFSQMQAIARELLEQASAGQELHATMEGRITIAGPRVTFKGDQVESFRISLVWLLQASAETMPIRKCPECGRFFVRVRRQIYCRDECTDRATWRKYPAAKKRAARKRQYNKHGWTFGARKRGKGRPGGTA
jgi:hypothetical protein